MYELEPIFIIFPLFCLLFAIIERKCKKLSIITVSLVFFIVYSFSLNGSDISAYKIIYESVGRYGLDSGIHSETGFKLLMLIFNKLNIGYIAFRVILLVSVTFVLFYNVNRISSNFSLSVFFLTTMFVIYTISTYRQYIVFAFTLHWLYKYSRGKKLQAMIGTGLLAFFHVSAILVLGMLFAFWLLNNYPYKWFARFNVTKLIFWLIFAFVLRYLFILAMRIEVFSSLMSRLTNGYSDDDASFISFGLFSRIAFLLAISLLIIIRKPKSKLVTLLFWFYFFGIILYVIVPFTTFSGRLFNNFHILSIVLVPLLCTEKSDKRVSLSKARGTVLQTRIILFILICVASLILINQLFNQDGYTPYLNILLGDKLP